MLNQKIKEGNQQLYRKLQELVAFEEKIIEEAKEEENRLIKEYIGEEITVEKLESLVSQQLAEKEVKRAYNDVVTTRYCFCNTIFTFRNGNLVSQNFKHLTAETAVYESEYGSLKDHLEKFVKVRLEEI